MNARAFRYGLDPVCLVSCALYALNRWLIKPHVSSVFMHDHFNDLLLIPCALPIMLWIQRRLGMRLRDTPPDAREIGMHLVVWSILAEVIGPFFLNVGISDWKDFAAYCAGAFLSRIAWGGMGVSRRRVQLPEDRLCISHPEPEAFPAQPLVKD